MVMTRSTVAFTPPLIPDNSDDPVNSGIQPPPVVDHKGQAVRRPYGSAIGGVNSTGRDVLFDNQLAPATRGLAVGRRTEEDHVL